MIHQSATQESLKMLLSVKEQSSKVCKEFDIKSFISHRTFLLFYFFIASSFSLHEIELIS